MFLPEYKPRVFLEADEETTTDNTSLDTTDDSSTDNTSEEETPIEEVPMDTSEIANGYESLMSILTQIKAVININQELFNSLTNDDLRRETLLNRNELLKTNDQVKELLKKVQDGSSLNLQPIITAITSKLNILTTSLDGITSKIKSDKGVTWQQ